MNNRFLIDDDSGNIQRGESALRAQVGRLNTNFSYITEKNPTLANPNKRDEFLTTTATFRLTDRWTVGGTWREDLDVSNTIAQSVILRYRDDCTLISLNYRFDNQRGNSQEFDITR